jgi:hypothetical protein
MSDYSDLIVADGAVGYWRLGESSGTDAVAVVGTNGTYKNTPTLGVTGAITADADTAVTFLDSSFEDMNVAAVDLNATDNFTLECWAKPNSLSGAGALVSCGTTANGYYIRVGTDLKPRGFTNPGGGLTDGGTAMADAVWSHVVFRRSAGTNSVWINGVQADPGTNNTGTVTAPTTRTCIAAIADDNTFWKGSLDEVALYDAALADADILAHYNEGIATGGFAHSQAVIIV